MFSLACWVSGARYPVGILAGSYQASKRLPDTQSRLAGYHIALSWLGMRPSRWGTLAWQLFDAAARSMDPVWTSLSVQGSVCGPYRIGMTQLIPGFMFAQRGIASTTTRLHPPDPYSLILTLVDNLFSLSSSKDPHWSSSTHGVPQKYKCWLTV